MDLVSILVFILVLGLLWWAFTAIAAALSLPPPIVTIVYVIFVVIVVLFLLQSVGLWTGGPTLRLR